MTGLEKDLVADCQRVAERMNAWVAVVGQRRAKGSGTTIGYPDLTLFCSGQVRLIELKRTKTADTAKGVLNLGQIAFIENARSRGVTVHVVDRIEDFIAIVNDCRKPHGREVRKGVG